MHRLTTGGVLATALAGSALAASGHLPDASPIEPVDVRVKASEPPDATGRDIPADGPIAAFQPIVDPPEPVDVDALVKAVGLAQKQREAAGGGASTCRAGTTGFGDVASWVATAGRELRCRFDVDTVFGVAGRSGRSDDPDGLALDLMVDRKPGEALADYVARNFSRLGISYVIYRQRINFGDGWKPMTDRGGATANHMDHVHVSFDKR